jgi:hypothetical protein
MRKRVHLVGYSHMYSMRTWNEPKPQALITHNKLVSKCTDIDIFQEQPTSV